MLEIELPAIDAWDSSKEEFVSKPAEKVYLEHSLLAVSKWESKWKIPFLDRSEKTPEMIADYFRCMADRELGPDFHLRLTPEIAESIKAYIEDPMTASWVSDEEKSRDGSKVTSELIYYWMVVASIPFEAERWHLNRLMMLIKIYGEKNKPEKKRSVQDIAERNRMLNEKRRREMGTSG